MSSSRLSGVVGHWVIGLCVLLLVVSLGFALYVYIRRKKQHRQYQQKLRHSDKPVKPPLQQMKYSIVPEFGGGTLLNTQPNQVQPPSRDEAKFNRIHNTNNYTRTLRRIIRYSDVSDDDDDDPVGRKVRRSVDDEVALSNIGDATSRRRDSWKRLSVRLKRVESGDVNGGSRLGQINFMLYYNIQEEHLTVNLLSGRHIHAEESYTVNLPVVSIQLHGYPDTEVTSSPDDAPNPDYDEKFTFDGVSRDMLLKSILRFTVWDVMDQRSHETRVLGFVLLCMENFHKILVDIGESGAVCREISPYLCFDDTKSFAGEVLLSLMYDCVTDRIVVTVRQFKGLFVNDDDVDVYLRLALLFNNDAVQTKNSATFTASENMTLNQTFEFNALSADLELLSNTTEFCKMSLELKDKEIEIKGVSSETLRYNMSISCTVRASTTSQSKRMLGQVHVGKTNDATMADENFHWEEMVRHFDSTITQWHILRVDY